MHILTDERLRGLDIALSGRFDAHQTDRFGGLIDWALHRGQKQIALDLASVLFMDAGALEAVTAAKLQTEAAGGGLEITRASRKLQVIFEVTGMHHLQPSLVTVARNTQDSR